MAKNFAAAAIAGAGVYLGSVYATMAYLRKV